MFDKSKRIVDLAPKMESASEAADLKWLECVMCIAETPPTDPDMWAIETVFIAP